MSTTYTDGMVTVTKDMIFGWALLVLQAGKSQPEYRAFTDLEVPVLQAVLNRVRGSAIFPDEIREAAQKALDDATDKEFRLTVANTQENWDLLEQSGVNWYADEETQTKMVAVFRTAEALNTAREALAASSRPFPS